VKNRLRYSCFILFLFVMPFSHAFAKKPLPPPKHGGVYVVAHRGAHRGIPENSLPAYRKAAELGVDFVEVDVRTTRDGVLVSCHNADIGKYAPGLSGKVHEFTFAQLEKIDIGGRAGVQWKETHIPALNAVFQAVQGRCGVYLDLKETPIQKLVTLVQNYHMENDVLWYSPFLRVEMFRRLHRLCPNCLAMPDPGPGWLLPLLLKMERPRVVASVWSDFSRPFAERCHRAGALVIVDEGRGGAEEWQKLIDWGADGIQTDDPQGLIQFLEKRSHAR